LAFEFGRQSGVRASSGALDQVSEQLRAERERVRVLERENRILRAAVKSALRDSLAAASSPSASVH
jgi:hypothetical protein